MWDILLDALIDSVKLLPILFVAYVIIEIIEVKTSKSITQSKFLKGKFAPLTASGVGLIPQCGFSVLATDMFTHGQIAVGTLLSIYITTSDEAIPLLLLHPDKYKDLLLILVIKFVVALIVGYGTMLVLKLLNKPVTIYDHAPINDKKTISTTPKNAEVSHSYLVGEIEEEHHVGCCGHDIEDEQHGFWHFVYHPLMHCLKIFIFVLLVNIAFNTAIYFIGESTISASLNSTRFFQPFIASLIGLIPNCAASIIITQMFIDGSLTLGACVAGLITNAGIGLAVLAKQNKKPKQTINIIITLYLVAVITGTIVSLF